MKKKSALLINLILAALVIFYLIICCGCKKDETVKEKVITGISLDTGNVKKYFDYGEPFSYEGLVVFANYDDDSKKEVPVSQCNVSLPPTGKEGLRSVNVSYLTFSASYNITIRQRDIFDPPMATISNGGTYRIEAEDLDLSYCVSNNPADAGDLIVDVPDAYNGNDTSASGGKALHRLGVGGNIIGFSVQSDDNYENVRFLLRVSYAADWALDIDKNVNFEFNGSVIKTESSITGDVSNYSYYKWEIIDLNINLIKGSNKFAFTTLIEAPNYDYFELEVNR